MRLALRWTTLKCLAIAPFVVLLLAGCQSLFNPPRPELRLPTGEAVVRAAQMDYNYGIKRPTKDTTIPGLKGPSVPNSDAPDMTIETMTLKNAALPNPLFLLLARIESTGAYLPMGIRRGENYVWRDNGGTNWITARGSSQRHKLSRHPTLDLSALNHHEPNLLKITVNSITFVVCLDDCFPAGHCGYQ